MAVRCAGGLTSVRRCSTIIGGVVAWYGPLKTSTHAWIASVKRPGYCGPRLMARSAEGIVRAGAGLGLFLDRKRSKPLQGLAAKGMPSRGARNAIDRALGRASADVL